MILLNENQLLLFAALFIADYFFQRPKENEDEKQKPKSLFFSDLAIHFIVLIITLFTVWLIFLLNQQGDQSIPLLLSILGIHMLLDLIYTGLEKKFKDRKLHGTLLSSTFWLHISFLLLKGLAIYFLSQYIFPLQTITFPSRFILQWLLLLVSITVPANTIFKIAFAPYQVKKPNSEKTSLIDAENQKESTVPGAGALIGNMERLITAMLMNLGQFSAIGLIYTAKSVARFDKISKDQAFAEYYLIGTLYSILYVILAYRIIF